MKDKIRECKEDNDIKNYEFLFQVIKDRFKTEFDSSDRKDEKAAILFGFNGVIFSIIVSSNLSINPNLICFKYLGVLFIITSIVLSFCVIKTRTYRVDPDPENLWKKYENDNYKNTLKRVTVNYIESFKNNKKVIDEKGNFVNIAYKCSIIGIFLFFLSII